MHKLLRATVILIVFSGSVWLSFSLSSDYFGDGHRPSTTTITVYSAAGTRQITSGDPRFLQLMHLVEAVLYDAPDPLFESAGKPDFVSSPGTAVQIMYDHSVQLTQRNWFYPPVSITVDRILLKVTGSIAGRIITGNGHYDSTPWSTTATTTLDAIRGLVD